MRAPARKPAPASEVSTQAALSVRSKNGGSTQLGQLWMLPSRLRRAFAQLPRNVVSRRQCHRVRCGAKPAHTCEGSCQHNQNRGSSQQDTSASSSIVSSVEQARDAFLIDRSRSASRPFTSHACTQISHEVLWHTRVRLGSEIRVVL